MRRQDGVLVADPDAGGLVPALFREKLPAWARMLWIVALSGLLVAGPLQVYFDRGSQILVRIAYSGQYDTGAYQQFFVRWLQWLDGSRWPELLLYGVPAIAACLTLARKGRPDWAWTEWAGLGLVLAWSSAWWLDHASVDFTSAAERISTVIVRGVIVAGMTGLSWLIVRLLGPCWVLWIDPESANSRIIELTESRSRPARPARSSQSRSRWM